MSLVHENLKRDGAMGCSWYLKLADGSTYGPVGVNTLCEWAAQSRIVPGNKVSSDGRRWVPAETVRELKMEWSAELPNGDKYGPFNVLAVPHLFHSGTLPPDAKLINRISGKTVPVYELVKASLDKKEAKPTETGESAILAPAKSADMGPKEIQIEFEILEPPPASRKEDTTPVAEGKTGPDIHDLESRIKYLTLQLEHTKREWARDKDALSKKTSASEAELSGQADRLRIKVESAEGEVERLKNELNAERKRYQELQEQARRREDELQAETTQLTTQLESRTVEVDRSKEEHEHKTAELSLRAGELETLLKESTDKLQMFEKDLAGQKEHYEFIIGQEREQEDGLKRAVTEIQRELDVKTNLLVEAERTLEEEKQTISGLRAAESQREQELQRQVNALGEQLDGAKREMEEQRGRYARLEQHGAAATDELKQQVAGLQAKAAAATNELEKAKIELDLFRSKSSDATKAAIDEKVNIQHELDATRKALAEAEQKRAEKEMSMEESEIRKQQLAEESERIRERASKISEEIEKLRRELSVRDREKEGLGAQNLALNRELQETKAKLHHAAEERELAVQQLRGLQEASRSTSEAHRQLADAKAQCEALRKETAAGGEKYGQLKEQFTAISGGLDAAKSDLRHALEQRAALEKHLAQQKETSAAQIAELESEKERYKEVAERAGAQPAEPARRKPFPFFKLAAALVVLAGIACGFFFVGQKSYEFRLESELPAPEFSETPIQTLSPEATAKPSEPEKVVRKEKGSFQIEPLMPAQPKKERPQLPKATLSWPEIKVNNVRVTWNEKLCTIIFDFGIFRSLTKFSDGAQQTLEQVAAQLRGGVKDFDIIIEGHADLVPVSSQAAASFADNEALGMKRAEAVHSLFRDKFNIPADHMKVVSAGEKEPPFSNDDETTRKKNRTVVLKLVPRTQKSE